MTTLSPAAPSATAAIRIEPVALGLPQAPVTDRMRVLARAFLEAKPDATLDPMADPTEPARRRLASDTNDGMLLIISGPSGVGKTTITRSVERAIPGSVFSVSATTRPPRAGDVEGVDYHFVDEPTFVSMIERGEFLEHVQLFGRRYGTVRAWVQEQLKRGRLVILEIDVVGAIKVKQQMPDAFAMFVLPPTEQTLLDRLHARNREGEEEIQRRFAEAKREIEQARTSKVYDHFIVNDQLDKSIVEAVATVLGERERRRLKALGSA